MINPCSFPVEVVSLEVDRQYAANEDVLRAIDEAHFNDAGIMYEVRCKTKSQIVNPKP